MANNSTTSRKSKAKDEPLAVSLLENFVSDIYPWQRTDWKKLRQYQTNDSIPHALLLTGKQGLAKSNLALLWAETLLCESIFPGSLSDDTAKACGECASCSLFQSGSHPDFLVVEPSEPGKAIKVDQIRDLVEFVSLTCSRAKFRIIVISPAEAMNVNAANSLLKTLEEPPPNTIVILVSASPASLPATIRSRCRIFAVSPATSEVLQNWLAQRRQNTADEREFALSISENSPVNAAFYLDSAILKLNSSLLEDWYQLAIGTAKASKIAEKWLKQADNLPIKLVYTWVVDMIRYRSLDDGSPSKTDAGMKEIFYYKYNQQIESLACSIPLKRLFGIYDKVIELIKPGNTALNDQIQLESLLIQWSLVAQTSSK